MNRVADALKSLSAEGVPYRALGDIATLVRGNGMPRSDLTAAGVGAIHYGDIYTRYRTSTLSTHSFVGEEKAQALAKVDPGDLIVTNTSENLAEVGKAVAWLGSSQIVTGGHATVVKHDLNPLYLSYWFQSPSFHEQKQRLATGTKVIDVSSRALAQIRVPVPSRAIQDELVAVLEQFSAAEAELEAELEAESQARRRQYAQYRDQLLAPRYAAGEQLVTIGQVGTLSRGRRFTRADLAEEGLPAIHYGDIYTKLDTTAETAVSFVRPELASKLRFAQHGDVIIAAVSETVEDVGKAVAWLNDTPVAIHDDCFMLRHDMNPTYVAYSLQTTAFHAEKAKYVDRAKIKRLSGSDLARMHITRPTRSEQDRVVETLDALRLRATHLSFCLPAELAARRKQYEYYRDRLLSFEELAA